MELPILLLTDALNEQLKQLNYVPPQINNHSPKAKQFIETSRENLKNNIQELEQAISLLETQTEKQIQKQTRLDQVKITLPIVKSRKSNLFALILTDSDDVSHYFNFDGTYSGYLEQGDL